MAHIIPSNKNGKNIFRFAIVANILEWYEFSIYGFLAIIIAELFFKTNSIAVSISYAFFVFSLSYLIRPLGSVFFGYMCDRYGRKTSLQTSTLLMSIPTIFIGLIPTYETIGYIAIILLIILRLLQGFAAGGELPGSACLVYESSPVEKRSLFCSAVSMSSLLGMLLGSITITLLFEFLDKETILEWGWRLPFLLGLPITIAIVLMRSLLIETIRVPINTKRNSLLFELLKYRTELFIAITLTGFVQVCLYLLFVWMPTFLTIFLKIEQSLAQASNMIGLFSLVLCVFMSGYISLFFRQKTIILFSIIGMLIFPIPAFLILPHASFLGIVCIQLVFSVILGGLSGLLFRLLGDIFPSQIRGSGMSISFTVATALLGGTAPTICNLAISETGILLFPAIYIMLFSLTASFGAYFLFKSH